MFVHHICSHSAIYEDSLDPLHQLKTSNHFSLKSIWLSEFLCPECFENEHNPFNIHNELISTYTYPASVSNISIVNSYRLACSISQSKEELTVLASFISDKVSSRYASQNIIRMYENDYHMSILLYFQTHQFHENTRLFLDEIMQTNTFPKKRGVKPKAVRVVTYTMHILNVLIELYPEEAHVTNVAINELKQIFLNMNEEIWEDEGQYIAFNPLQFLIETFPKILSFADRKVPL